jgi:hypothetical protein
MKKITEAMIQRAILDYLQWYSLKNKVYFFRSGAGHVALESGRRFKTGKPGCPDITVCGAGGQFIGVEVKTATGRQSASQKKAEAEILAAGGRYELCRSLDDIKRIFPMDKP